MERVSFLLDDRRDERISALLNPESLVIRRRAGVRSRGSTTGRLTGLGLADDALLFTGGGRTELELDLLFDTSLAGSSVESDDVRQLTQPLWRLAENHHDAEGRARPHAVRFVWGKAWNIPGVVTSVAEKLERFSAAGVPSRSWLRLRFLRLAEPPAEPAVYDQPSPLPPSALVPTSGETSQSHRLLGDGAGGGERLDQVAQRFYGHSSFWRLVARANRAVGNPLRLPPNTVLDIPEPPRPEGRPREGSP